MNADLDSSTTEWIEAQLSAGAAGGIKVNSSTGEVKWDRLREGLQGVVHRLATEVRSFEGRQVARSEFRITLIARSVTQGEGGGGNRAASKQGAFKFALTLNLAAT